MKRYIIPVFALILFQMVSCNKEQLSDSEPNTDLGALHVTFSDGSGYFNPVRSTPYGDTIVFEFPTHFPLDSENVMDLSNMVLNSVAPSRVEVVGQTSNSVDLSKQVSIVIHKGSGQTSRHIVKGIIKKSAIAELLSFSLPDINLQGYVKGNIVNLIAGGVDLSNLTPAATLSSRASIIPALDIPQDFTSPVEYTVVAEDGVTIQKYSVQQATPNKVENGIRTGSGRLLWTKSLSELGIDPVNHMTTSITVSTDKLVVNTREQRNTVINRFSGNVVGQMEMGGIAQEAFQNFFVTSDKHGRLLMSNLVTAAGNKLAIYKWTDVQDVDPIKIIDWTLDAAWQVGRKMSVVGDLDQSAAIYLAASNSGNTVLRWMVRNGQVVSQVPEKLRFPGTTNWTLMADVVPLGYDEDDPIIITGSPGNVSYWNVADNTILGQLQAASLGLQLNTALDAVEFNTNRYVSFGNVEDIRGEFFLYDVTHPENLSASPTSSLFQQSLAFRTGWLPSNSNGNRTSDVVLKASDDGYKMHMYCILTNGSIAAYEFDCIDFNSL